MRGKEIASGFLRLGSVSIRASNLSRGEYEIGTLIRLSTTPADVFLETTMLLNIVPNTTIYLRKCS